MGTPELSVIIPTYNRAPILEWTLRALCEDQQGLLPPWELIVVDDGSTDDTRRRVLRYAEERGNRIRYFHQPNRKQGAARNHGMRHARGRLFVFLGDDTIPAPGFLAAHWGRFRREEGRRHAVIGRTDWHPSISETPFREWINEWGLQFGFKLIRDPEKVPFNFFYTSNLSFSRDLYDDWGGFDESFREYGWEDIELGYRYMRQGGMRLRYEPEALAYHHHRLTLSAFCRRQYRVGYSAVKFHALHPELADFLHIAPLKPGWRRWRRVFDPIVPLVEILDERFGWNVNRLAGFILRVYYRCGMLEAQSEAGRR